MSNLVHDFSALAPLSSVLPPDERRMGYVYVGKRVYCDDLPLYLHDSERAKPTLVLGSTGYGKSELMLSLAYNDASKGRAVFYLDGKCDMATRDKLAYYCKHVAKRPFYCFLPYVGGDTETDTWNPFICRSLSMGALNEAFFCGYNDPGQKKGNDGAQYYYDSQRKVFNALLRTLHTSGYQFNTQDIRAVLELDSVFTEAAEVFVGRPESARHYDELARIKKEIGKKWQEQISRLFGHLSSFDHWSINSYNPTIQFDKVIEEGGVVYAGLPLSSQPVTMGAIGNIIINQLKALSASFQNGRAKRTTVSCIIDDGASFVDTGMAEWITKVRSSGFLLTLGIQTVASVEGRRQGFGDELRSNTPNVFLFNPRDEKTAKWFSALCLTEKKTEVSASIKSGEISADGSMKIIETDRITADSILSLKTGECFFLNPTIVGYPPLLKAPFLPSPPSANPIFKYRRPDRNEPPLFTGIKFFSRAMN